MIMTKKKKCSRKARPIRTKEKNKTPKNNSGKPTGGGSKVFKRAKRTFLKALKAQKWHKTSKKKKRKVLPEGKHQGRILEKDGCIRGKMLYCIMVPRRK